MIRIGFGFQVRDIRMAGGEEREEGEIKQLWSRAHDEPREDNHFDRIDQFLISSRKTSTKLQTKKAIRLECCTAGKYILISIYSVCDRPENWGSPQQNTTNSCKGHNTNTDIERERESKQEKRKTVQRTLNKIYKWQRLSIFFKSTKKRKRKDQKKMTCGLLWRQKKKREVSCMATFDAFSSRAVSGLSVSRTTTVAATSR